MTISSSRPQAVIPPYMTTEIYKFYAEKLSKEEEANLDKSQDTEDSAHKNLTINVPEPAEKEGEKQVVASVMQPSKSPIEVWDHRTKSLLLSSSKRRLSTRDTDALATNLYMQITDLFFRTAFHKYPINTTSHLMRCYVHDSRAFNNAFWYPTDGSLHFGEVDPRIFTPLVLKLDIAAHEVTHAYTQFSSNFRYFRQSGALNESMSDVYGIMTKHFKTSMNLDKPVDASSEDANWLIGEGIIANPEGRGSALRDMRNPGTAYCNRRLGKDPQPDHMDHYANYADDEDNGGVHINSGIPNRAFYYAASTIGGPSWEKAGKIWDVALYASGEDETFDTFANRTMTAARNLSYNEGIVNLVGKAWTSVGVKPSSTATVTTTSKTPTDPTKKRCCFIQ